MIPRNCFGGKVVGVKGLMVSAHKLAQRAILRHLRAELRAIEGLCDACADGVQQGYMRLTGSATRLLRLAVLLVVIGLHKDKLQTNEQKTNENERDEPN